MKDRSASEGVILRPSPVVSSDVFEKHVGKSVKVSGSYVEAKPYVPVDEGEQYPLGEDGGAPRSVLRSRIKLGRSWALYQA